MFPFKKKTTEPKKETSHEQVRRRLDETGARLGEAVRKMEARCAERCFPEPKLKLVK